MQLLDVVLFKLRAETGFAMLGKALSQDLQPLPGRHGPIVETRQECHTL